MYVHIERTYLKIVYRYCGAVWVTEKTSNGASEMLETFVYVNRVHGDGSDCGGGAAVGEKEGRGKIEEEKRWISVFCRNKGGEKRKNGFRFCHFL
ncbi:hypothetical protein LguiA_009147 [Lonicera macranthoides]